MPMNSAAGRKTATCAKRHDMARPILDDDLWTLIEPMLPPPKPRRFRYPGRKPITNRQARTGIIFV